MCDSSHTDSNHLTLLFIVHHAQDDKVVGEILVRTLCTLEGVKPATLNQQETEDFEKLISNLQENILSSESVEEQREKEKMVRDCEEQNIEIRDEENRSEEDKELVNDVYRVLKNNQILGQILRNKHGSLTKSQNQ